MVLNGFSRPGREDWLASEPGLLSSGKTADRQRLLQAITAHNGRICCSDILRVRPDIVIFLSCVAPHAQRRSDRFGTTGPVQPGLWLCPGKRDQHSPYQSDDDRGMPCADRQMCQGAQQRSAGFPRRGGNATHKSGACIASTCGPCAAGCRIHALLVGRMRDQPLRRSYALSMDRHRPVWT